MSWTMHRACAMALVVLAFVPAMPGRAQVPSTPPATLPVAADPPLPGSPIGSTELETSGKASDATTPGSVFNEEGAADTTWETQFDALWHALARLPTAAVLSAILAFRPRRRGTPTRQASVIQTQIILAIVGAMVMLVVGASLARAFGIVGAAGLVRYRAKIEDPKDAGVMLATLGIGLASGVGLFLFAIFATVFVLAVLVAIESIDPEPYLLFDLTITAKQSASAKDPIEAVLQRRRIPFELRSTSADEICYEVKLPLNMHTDKVSEALMSLKPAQTIGVKWEQKKATKAS